MNIGFLRAGLMIQPMVLRLLGANLDVTVFNRTPSKIQALQALGVNIVDSPDAFIKLALNHLIAGLTRTFTLRLGFVKQQGVDVDKFMSIVRQSASYAPIFDKKLSRMSNHNYSNSNFPTKHLLKDTNLFLTQAETLGLDTSSLKGIKQIMIILLFI